MNHSWEIGEDIVWAAHIWILLLHGPHAWTSLFHLQTLTALTFTTNSWSCQSNLTSSRWGEAVLSWDRKKTESKSIQRSDRGLNSSNCKDKQQVTAPSCRHCVFLEPKDSLQVGHIFWSPIKDCREQKCNSCESLYSPGVNVKRGWGK